MSRLRFRFGSCLALLAISLIVFGAQAIAPTASAAGPPANARAIAKVMQIQDRHTNRLMAIPGVVGTATALNPAGQPVVKVFLARGGIRGIPAKLDGVPVAVEVTGVFVALPKRATPPGQSQKNKAPVVTIVSPTDGSTFVSGATIDFEGTATDKEDGDLSGSLAWTSDLDGAIGTGANVSKILGNGTHTITASVIDSGGKTGTASITITVGDAPEKPPLWCDRPVPIGVSTGHPNITAGTIGCRVTDGTNVYALSNNHVYADCNKASIGDNVLQPGPYDGGVDPDDAIGVLAPFVPIEFGPKGTNTIDAAIALSSTLLLDNATASDYGYGTPKSTTVDAFLGQKVQKYGRTTGLTFGVVDNINATVRVGYGRGWALFTDQIIVTPGDFSAGGDSGSLVVVDDEGGDDDLKPVGLLFAGSISLTVCNPIDEVLRLLGEEIESELTIDGD